MSTLIKSMKIPKRCIDCPFNSSSLYCSITHSEIDRDDEYYDRLPDCPIVELPEHHGDLVDVNEIRWDDHYDSDGNLSKYKIAYSDEMPDPVIKVE